MKDQNGNEISEKTAEEIVLVLNLLDAAHEQVSTKAFGSALIHKLGSIIGAHDFPALLFEDTIRNLKIRVKIVLQELKDKE